MAHGDSWHKLSVFYKGHIENVAFVVKIENFKLTVH